MTNNHSQNYSTPLDPIKLGEITAGQKTFQEELLEMFFFNVNECLELMERVSNDGNCDKWKDVAEELKNISCSLGAIDLERICTAAEKMSAANQDEKKQIISNIRSNVHKLRVFVKDTRY